jgi:hypothetical protein
MPGGGLLQLVAYGAQDVYLTGQPKVTFFQSTYRRHTNFAMELVQQNVSGAGGNGGLQSVVISRSGDLVGDMFVALTPTTTSAAQLTSNNVVADMNWVAERAFDYISLFIGGQLIDKHYQTWFRLYSEVFLSESKKITYGRLTSLALAQNNLTSTNTSIGKVYLPLMFFFNKNPGLYLPIIALQYHEVRLDFQFSSIYSNYFGTNQIEVWANYIYLDKIERESFAKLNHEYLIEQVQYVAPDPVGVSSENAPSIIRMQFNHPVKELIWCYMNPNYLTNPNAMWNFSSGTANVNVTIDTNKLAQAQSMFQANHIGSPALFVPPYLTNSSGSLYVNANSNVLSGNTISVQSNVLTGNVYWVEPGMPNYGLANVSYGYEVGPLHQFKILLNGTDRFVPQPGKYFNAYQAYQYHSGAPYPGIYIYSFALKPEELQPSGTCNFSRIDIAQAAPYLKTGMPTNLVQRMYAVNYNILRIQSGLGGLAFSN